MLPLRAVAWYDRFVLSFRVIGLCGYFMLTSGVIGLYGRPSGGSPSAIVSCGRFV